MPNPGTGSPGTTAGVTRARRDGATRGPAGGGNRAGPGGAWDPARPAGRPGLRTLRHVGPVVGEAMRANATLRAFSGFTCSSSRSCSGPCTSRGNDKMALGGMLAAATVGGFLGTATGSALRSRRPYSSRSACSGAATVVTAACALFFGLWAALVVALVAAFGQVLAKLALDSTVQQEIGEDRSGPPPSPSRRPCTSCPGWPAGWPAWPCP